MSRPGYLSTKEAAERLGYAQSTITRWVRAGLIAAHRGPSAYGRGTIRIPVSEVERLLAAGPPNGQETER